MVRVQSVGHAGLGDGIVVGTQPGTAPGPHLIRSDKAFRPALGYGSLIELCFALKESAGSHTFRRSMSRPSVLDRRSQRSGEQRRIYAEIPPHSGKLIINTRGHAGDTRRPAE